MWEKDAVDRGRAVELHTDATGLESAGSGEAAAGPKETVAELIARYLSEQPAHSAKVAAIGAWLADLGRFPSEPGAAGQNVEATGVEVSARWRPTACHSVGTRTILSIPTR